MAKRLNDHLHPDTQDWLRRMGVDRRINLSNVTILGTKDWDAIANWSRDEETQQKLARCKDLEQAACLAFLDDIKPVSPTLLENSSTFMGIWKSIHAK